MSLRLLSKDFAFYGSLDLIQRAMAVVLVPIYTRVLTKHEYGDLDLIITAGSALLVLVDLQFGAGFARLFLEHHRRGSGPSFAGMTAIVRAGLGTAVAGLIMAAGFAGSLEVEFLPSFLGNSTAWTLVLLNIPLTLAYDILLLQTRMLRWGRLFAFGAVGNIGLASVLCVAFTVIVPLGIVGVALGQLLGKLVPTLFLVVGLLDELDLRVQRGHLREMLKYTLPLVPGWWLAFSSAYVGRFFVYGTVGAEHSAILAIATKLVSVVGLFSVSFRMAWQPLAMGYIGEEGGHEFYVRSLRVFLAAAAFSAFGLCAFGPAALAVLAPASYAGANAYVPLFAVATIVAELEANLQLGNQIARKPHWISLGAAAGFAANAIVLATLTPRAGVWAVGLGLLASSLVRTLVTYVSGERNCHIPYDKRAFRLFAAGCLCLLGLGQLSGVSPTSQLLASTIMVGCAALFPLVILGPEERSMARSVAVQGAARLVGR